jgi:hypothetical protein
MLETLKILRMERVKGIEASSQIHIQASKRSIKEQKFWELFDDEVEVAGSHARC